MMGQDTQQICMLGHLITQYYHSNPELRSDHCEKCGSKTIHFCPKCKNEIPGGIVDPQTIAEAAVEIPIPDFCKSCGSAYPWAKGINITTEISGLTNSAEQNLITICKRFHLVTKQILKRHDNRPTFEIKDEYDVQDIFHALLRINFDDIRPEEWAPSYAGGSSRMDFLLKLEEIVIEIKKTRKGLGAKEIGEQLIIDIAKYQKHPFCKTLICFVYDPEGMVNNPRGLENDLSGDKGALKVLVIITPQGY